MQGMRYGFLVVFLVCLTSLTCAMGATPVADSGIHQVSAKNKVVLSESGTEVVVLNTLSGLLAQAVTLYSPQQTLTTGNKFLIKGVNRYLTDVFVNNTKLPLRQDGRFVYEVSLPKFGENTIWLSLIEPDLRVAVIPIRVTRLYSVVGETNPTSDAILIANSVYVDRKESLGLSTVVTRLLFAKALAAYANHLPVAKIQPVDVSDARVGQVMAAGLLAGFPDGTFRPDQPVKLLDYVVSVTRVLNLDLQRYNTVVLPRELEGHWSAPYVKALLAEGLLLPSEALNFGQTLTFATFSMMWARLPDVSRILQLMRKPAEPVYSREIILRGVSAALVQTQQLRTSLPKAALGPNSTEQKVPTAPVSGYADMSGHWVENTAAKFFKKGWRFDATSEFSPKKRVTRLELALLLDKIFAPAQGIAKIQPTDVSDADLPAIQRVIAAGWMSVHSGLFLPDQIVSKAEMVTVMSRILAVPKVDAVSVYKDVPPTHWAVAEVAALVSVGVLTPGGFFQPSRGITRAESVAFLAKVPSVKEKIND